ncbi:hypothetical protein PG985_016004 [Apiospora marii]|uniref:uncharacterized protein n=1 Tax=Apiospora marii TaxID=335849 RepID=UPI00313079A1
MLVGAILVGAGRLRRVIPAASAVTLALACLAGREYVEAKAHVGLTFAFILPDASGTALSGGALACCALRLQCLPEGRPRASIWRAGIGGVSAVAEDPVEIERLGWFLGCHHLQAVAVELGDFGAAVFPPLDGDGWASAGGGCAPRPGSWRWPRPLRAAPTVLGSIASAHGWWREREEDTAASKPLSDRRPSCSRGERYSNSSRVEFAEREGRGGTVANRDSTVLAPPTGVAGFAVDSTGLVHTTGTGARLRTSSIHFVALSRDFEPAQGQEGDPASAAG